MDKTRTHAVTGAFGFTGKYIARRLLAAGQSVITLTGNPARSDPFGGKVPTHPFTFENVQAMAESLRGIDTLYNTYWVRFDRGKTTYEKATANTMALIKAAEAAGVRRLVHVSISNPDRNSPLPYFRGKAEIEDAIRAARLSHAILRPAVIFGDEDILINNIAWTLRRFPFFPIAGNGEYKLQPIFVDDLAALAVEAGNRTGNETIEAIGPETFSYHQLVNMLGSEMGITPRQVHLPPPLVYAGAWMVGLFVRDVFLTWDELKGLMGNILFTPGAAPAGQTKLSDWVRTHRATLGRRYASELMRHYRA